MLGNLYVKAGRSADAIAAYRRALAIDPEHRERPSAWRWRIRIAGRADEARAGIRARLALDPRNGKALFQLADVAMRRGDFSQAEGSLTRALALEVDRPPFLVKLGECCIEMKRWNDAERALRAALAERGDIERAHYDLALVLEARGDTPGAIAEYEAELARGASHSASFNLGRLLARTGRPGDAAQRFRESIGANPSFAPAHLYLSKALLDAGDLEAAEAAARRGLELKPAADVAPLGHYVLADVYSRLGRSRDAAREVARAAARTPMTLRLRSGQAGACVCAVVAATAFAGCSSRDGQPAPSPRATCCSSRSTRSARIASAATAAGTSRRRPRSAGRRRGACARRDGPRAAHPAVARLALHRPLSRGTRDTRQHRPRARRGCADAGDDPVGGGLSGRGVCVVDRVVGAVRAEPGVRHLQRALRSRRGRRALSDTIQRSGQDTVADAIAWMREQDTRRFRRVGASLRAARSGTSRRSPTCRGCDGRPHDGEVAWTDELVGRLLGALESSLAPPGDPRDRHVGPWRRARRS